MLTLACVVYRHSPAPFFAAASLFFILPFVAHVETYPVLHSPELDDLAKWARESTTKDSLFQFADIGRGLEPGVFRARAVRALYADWKAGGQANFLEQFAKLWSERWTRTAKPLPVDAYRELGIDYVVFRARNKAPGRTPAYENKDWVVYDVRNASTSLREGMEAWAPIRVTDIAAAAFAKRSASGNSLPSVRATARAALKVSPAAVASQASTLNAGACHSLEEST
jgi:hypothetical protein